MSTIYVWTLRKFEKYDKAAGGFNAFIIIGDKYICTCIRLHCSLHIYMLIVTFEIAQKTCISIYYK